MPRYSESTPDLAAVGRVLADPSRAAMLLALIDGRAWTPTELARHAGISKASATEHAHKLVGSGLCSEARQGRHRYLRIASGDVAEAVERLGALAGPVLPPAPTLRASVRAQALRNGRTCYRHLAGRLGVALADEARRIGLVSDAWDLTAAGHDWLDELGVRPPSGSRQPMSRPCLDWTERRDHLAGRAADALCTHLESVAWIARRPATRAVHLTELGRRELAARGLRLP
ncbi:MAG: ArsR/SmtB family transcription factor [Streptosporangiaceae bacterium]